jgi:hypothetical protein
MSSSLGCSNLPMVASASPQRPSQNRTHPFGLWPLPLDAEQVARQATAYDAVHTSGEAIYWLETRPSEDGRAVVVRWTDDARGRRRTGRVRCGLAGP